MKRIIYFALVLIFVLSLCACNEAKNEKKDGHDIKGDENLQDNTATDKKENGDLYESVTYATTYEKKSIRMFLVGDTLYYDTGKFSEMTPSCGTLDGYFSKVIGEGEVPVENNSSNFEADGYQNATDNTKEVNIGGEWETFAKFSETPTELERYKYCFYIKGRLNNAQADIEIVVLTDYENISQ